MSKYNGAEVSEAMMHESIFLPGHGDIRKELSSQNSATNQAIKMTIDEPFLILEFKSHKSHRNYTLPVPLTNFKTLVLAQVQPVLKPFLKEE